MHLIKVNDHVVLAGPPPHGAPPPHGPPPHGGGPPAPHVNPAFFPPHSAPPPAAAAPPAHYAPPPPPHQVKHFRLWFIRSQIIVFKIIVCLN